MRLDNEEKDGGLQLIQTTGDDAAMWEHQGDDLVERQREGSVLLNDLEALMTIAFESKEWMTIHTLKRRKAFLANLRPSNGTRG